MVYGEEFQITLPCQFRLEKYPFDSHDCLFYFGDLSSNSSQLKFNPMSIYYMDKTNDHFVYYVFNLDIITDLNLNSGLNLTSVRYSSQNDL